MLGSGGDGQRNHRGVRPILFVVLQRWQRDLGLSGVGTVHGLAVMAEGELGEAFGVAGGLGPLSPRVAVAVEADAGDAQTPAALAELVGAVAGEPTAEVREEGPALGRPLRISTTLWPNLIWGGV